MVEILRRAHVCECTGIGHNGKMRPGTTIILVVLLVLILGASALQLVLASR